MAKRGLMAITALSMLIFVCQGGNASMTEQEPHEPTARDWGCADSQAWKTQCAKGAEQCSYKFTVNEVDQQNLKVTYPPSVWKETMISEMVDNEAEKNYRNTYDKTYPIHLKGSSSPTAGKIYLFTRCTDNDNDFALGEIQPDEKDVRGGPQQSAH
jgi:hypothetical protein